MTQATEPMKTPEPPISATERNSPVSSGEFQGVPAERETGPELSSLQPTLHSNLDTQRERVREWLAGFRGYWTPPSMLTEPPASVQELAAYAWYGGWTTAGSGPVRRLGIWWHRLIGLSTTTVCRYVEWIAQRPGRAIPVYLLWKLLITTGPGPWVADNIIRPALGFLAWVLL